MDQDERRQRRALREALNAEERDQRSRERAERWTRENLHIGWEEYVADTDIACRGCGRPLMDRRGDWSPLLHMEDEERAAHSVEEEAWRGLHADCHEGRWSISGSRTGHCMGCCPPPPMSPDQIERIARIFSLPRPGLSSLDVWRLTLRCGHSIEVTTHRSNDRVTATVHDCPDCGERRGHIEAVRIGPADVPEHERRQAQRAETIHAAEAELRRAEARRVKAQQRLDALRGSDAP